MIIQNLTTIEETISESCKKANRLRQDITLIAVSKTQPLPLLLEAYEWGCRDFGENKVQEIIEKYDKMPKDVCWHMIGHLQRNKVKSIIDKVSLIHSVDSLRLAQEISKQALLKKSKMSILVEINIALEPNKYGLAINELVSFLEEISELKGISVEGFMIIAPFVENSEENRQYFKKLLKLSVDIKSKNIDNVIVDILSMGMSGDYKVAIEEGSTLIRIGTSIFGPRQ